MSNQINDEEEGDKVIKKTPFIDGEEIGESPKSRILLYYGLTVGAMLLIVIIVFVIAVKFGGTSSESGKKNSFTSRYISEDNARIKLFNSDLKNFISSMTIDGKESNITDEYTFESKGEHDIEVALKEELDSLEKLYRINCC